MTTKADFKRQLHFEYLLKLLSIPEESASLFSAFINEVTVLRDSYSQEQYGSKTKSGLKGLKDVSSDIRSVNGRAPFGYRWRYTSTGEGQLVPVVGELKLIRIMLFLRNDLEMTYEQIAGRLTELGIKTKRGGNWTASTVRKILLNQKNKLRGKHEHYHKFL